MPQNFSHESNGATAIGPPVLDLVETGGTIDMKETESRRPSGGMEKLVKAVQSFASDMRVHRLFNLRLDSSNIGPAEWKTILSTTVTLCNERIDWIRRNSPDGNQAVPGIVITHGSDTLQETALLLALELATIDISFPVILTCAYAPATETHSDALRNVVLAAVAALSFRLSREGLHQIPPGVYVVVGSELHLASRIKKVTTKPVNDRSYVESFPGPAGQLTIAHKANLAHLDIENEVRLRLHIDLCAPKRSGLLRPAKSDYEFGYVEHVWFKKDSPLEILERVLIRCHRHALHRNIAPALVLHGDFSNKPDEELQDLVALIGQFRIKGSSQVPVFSGSPAVVAKVCNIANRRNLLFLIPKSLSHAKARTKLSWLLREPMKPTPLARQLSRDIAGECFDVPVLPDWIAGESYGPNNHFDKRIAKRVVIVYPGIEFDVYAEAVESLIKANAKKKELNIIGFGDGNIPLGSMTVEDKVSEYIRDRYGLDCEFGDSATYRQVETELAAFLRYNSQFRATVAEKYELVDKNEMVREILGWCAREQRNSEHLLLERKANALFSVLADELGLNENKVRSVIEGNSGSILPVLAALMDSKRGESALGDVHEILVKHGLSIDKPPILANNVNTDLGTLLVPHLVKWLTAIEHDSQQRGLLARAMPAIYARRIMKDALAACHPVLKEIVRCVDLGMRVNIQSNAEMARTDTRRYELGNFLLVSGVDSGQIQGWHAGPLRLKLTARRDGSHL